MFVCGRIFNCYPNPVIHFCFEHRVTAYSVCTCVLIDNPSMFLHFSYGDGLTYPMNSSNPDEAQNSLLGWHQRCAEEGEDEDDSDVRKSN